MFNAMESSSTRPYLIRALYEWCTDNGFTPYVAVAVDDTVLVPREFVKNGEIVLNISFDATSSLRLGNDAIDGGAGTDTAVYGNAHTKYTVSKTVAGFTITGPQGMDTLTNVERLKFSDDTNIALDTSGVAGQAYRLYKAAFNRTPDQGGLGFWISVMDRGLSTLNEVAAGFVASAEYKAMYSPSMSNLELVNKYYLNILGRPAEPGGLAFWVGALDSPRDTVPEVLAAISESPENQASLIGVIANGFGYTPYLG